jgi:hypothetical protein
MGGDQGWELHRHPLQQHHRPPIPFLKKIKKGKTDGSISRSGSPTCCLPRTKTHSATEADDGSALIPQVITSVFPIQIEVRPTRENVNETSYRSKVVLLAFQR